MASETHRNALQPGFLVHWYAITRILGQGGFGITYLADDQNLHQQVAIKEYLPLDVSVREGDWSVHPVSENHDESFQWGLQRFLDEARTLARFDHPNIVRVLSVFEMNNTAYMVMRYESGKSFAQLLAKRATLDQARLEAVLLPILDGLKLVHEAGFIHRDIKPANLFIRDDDSPVLLDFGSARQSLGDVTRTLTTLVSPGYAPFEQYYSKSDKQGPWTDIYGLGATLYRATVGVAPMNAVDRSEGLLKRGEDPLLPAAVAAEGQYSPQFLRAIDWALRFDETARPQTIEEWKSSFDGGEIPAPVRSPSGDAAATTIAAGSDTAATLMLDRAAGTQTPDSAASIEAVKPPAKRRRRVVWIVLVIIVALLLALAAAKKIRQTRQAGSDSAAAPEQQREETAPHAPTTDPQPANEQQDTSPTIRQLLDAARTDIREHRLSRPAGNNALEKYRAVLAQDGDNEEARSGVRRIVETYVERAKQAAKDKNLDKAERYLREAMSIAPNSQALQKAIERLQKARRRLQ